MYGRGLRRVNSSLTSVATTEPLDANKEEAVDSPRDRDTMLYTCRLNGALRRFKTPLFAVPVIFVIAIILLAWRSFSLAGQLHWDLPVTEKVVSNIAYGIILDAGSTGSRIHVFRMRKTSKKSAAEPFELISEEFYFVKPGLSAYARDPKTAADSLKPLLARARHSIPAEHWAGTLTALRATAGLRLLSDAVAARILAEVRVLLRMEGLTIEDNAVSIMDGEEEGVLSWLTLNFMRRLLSRPTSTLGALDLGGGSTQITFQPNLVTTEMEAPKGFMVTYPLGPRKLRLYTHSYLGLGLMSARLQIMGGRLHGPRRNLSSDCLPADYSGKWRYGSEELQILPSGRTDFQSCFNTAAYLVTESHAVDWPAEARKRTFFAFSYFFDRAEDARLFAKGSPGRAIMVQEFEEAAKKACAEKNPRKRFLCMDLCYISALFLKGYRFERNTELFVMKRIEEVELSWGLGLMLKLLFETETSSKSRDPAVSL